MNVDMSAWLDPMYGAHTNPLQVHPKLRGGKNGQVQHTHSETNWLQVSPSCSSRGAHTSECVHVLVDSRIEQKEKKKGPVLECGGGGSDGGRNRWSLVRRKTWSICSFLWTVLQVFRDERPFPPQPLRTSMMVSLLFSCTQIPTTKVIIWEAVRPGACPCSSPLFLCTGRSLCLTESEPELPCSPS